MGRPETPIDYTIPALGEAAEILRAMRHSANLSYEELAARANFSPAHLKRAARGKWTSVDVIEAYAQACVKSSSDIFFVAEVKYLHSLAAKAITDAEREARRSKVVPKPQYARDEADLSGAMRDAWRRAARPTCRQIEVSSRGQVPRSTANAIANGHTVPRDLRQFVGFLNVCEISGDELAPWFRAWIKVRGVPTAEERRLVHKWMDADVAAIYFTEVLTRAQDQIEAGARTMMQREKAYLRTVQTEAREALRKMDHQRPELIDDRVKDLAVVDGQHKFSRILPVFNISTSRIAA